MQLIGSNTVHRKDEHSNTMQSNTFLNCRSSSSFHESPHCPYHYFLNSPFHRILALLCSVSSAFVVVSPSTTTSFATTSLSATTSYADEVDTVGNNVAVKTLLTKVQEERLLSKVAASGLLSKAQQAGISLSKVEPLLALAAEYPDILILVEASGPDLLKILPTVVDLAPGALPLLATAIATPPAVLQGAGLGALIAAAAAVAIIPDDTVTNVALQTLAVGLAVPLAGASLAGAAILSKLTK